MNKLVLVLSFIGLSISLAFGLIDPNNPIMWLSSTTTSFALLRAALLVVIFSLLITEPPRNAYLRVFVGLLSGVLVTWSVTSAYHNAMPICDAFLLFAVGLSSGITVLERDMLRKEKAAKHYLLNA
ncbi:MAG: hypothetical protein QFB86_04085 [Patescibacteria group bacterium]|nr:hypothetical protein [Patescibacteria group bacterium]